MAIATKTIDAERLAPAEQSQMAVTWKRFRKHKLGLTGLIILTLLTVSVIAIPFLTGWQYDEIDRDGLSPDPDISKAYLQTYEFKPAMWADPGIADGTQGHLHILGTDKVARDNFTRLFQGGRISLSVGLITTLIVIFLGSVVGALAGFYGGWVDTLLMRFVDLLLSLPTLPILLVISKMLDQSGVFKTLFGRDLGTVATIILVLALFGWLGISRLVRGSILSLRNLDFIEATRALGANNRRIIIRHLMPNSLAPIIVAATLGVGDFIITESFLSFLGLGIQDPTPSWGNLLQNSLEYASQITNLNPFQEVRGYLVLFPGILILLTVLSINFMGDAIRDALDPRLKM
ncbi:MAG: ABC transporter permease [Chloroflexia bacterium]